MSIKLTRKPGPRGGTINTTLVQGADRRRWGERQDTPIDEIRRQVVEASIDLPLITKTARPDRNLLRVATAVERQSDSDEDVLVDEVQRGDLAPQDQDEAASD